MEGSALMNQTSEETLWKQQLQGKHGGQTESIDSSFYWKKKKNNLYFFSFRI